jgi:hypothetical protein
MNREILLLNHRKGNMIIDCLYREQQRENIAPTHTSSTMFTTLARLYLSSRGGDVVVGFYLSITHETRGLACFDVALDGKRMADDFNGSLYIRAGNVGSPTSVSLTLRLEDVSPGSHILTLLWRTNRGELEGGHGQFWAMEG